MGRIELSTKSKGAVISVLVVVGAAGLVWALRAPRPGASTRRAREIVTRLRTMPASPLAASGAGQSRSTGLVGSMPELPVPTARHTARVTLPDRSTEPLRVEDNGTGMTIDVQVRDVTNVVAQSADGYYVYPHAHASGGTLLHRTVVEGAEDFVSFETRPTVPEVDYQVSLGDEVSGLRLVGDTLEMVDPDGTPRLRAEPPYVVGADGARTDATLAVEGCAVDTDASAPWGRDTVDPGARTCTVKVRWPDDSVVYPAVLDPRWTTTGSMTTARQGHTATLLSTGNVLVVGGTSNGTTALASAELYNRTTGTWAATGSMTGARTLHTATQLNTGSNGTTSAKVLVAGGLNGSTSQNTAQLYSPSAGTWTAATNLNAARHGQTATLLASGNVLLAAGLNGTAVLNTAAIYNPSSGTGTWTATGNMPQAVKFHTATRLNVASNGTLNNKVLIVGGNSGTASVSNVQLFDGTSTWSSLTALSATREGHTATALANGNVLVAGGKSGSTILNTTQLFNAASGSGSWSSAGTMTTARQLHAAILLPSALVENGQVLLAGGSNGSSTLSSAELWSGTTTWAATSALPSAVQGETATLLSNNMVLIAGGVNGSTTVATADLYDASFSLACTSNSQCATGFCVSGVCCDTACNGGCGVCNLTGHVGTCSAASSTTVCRAQNGACDVAEKCSGTSLTCPTDAVAALGTVCRPKADACDVPETCDGTTKACPTDGFAPATTVCRASTGTCDAAETCTGTSAACPADAFASAGTVCRPAAGGCDAAETCTGTSSLCPADTLAAAGTVCRPAESICDVAETCNGTSSACPTDTFAAAGTACGAATNNAPAPVCSGASGTCPVAGGTSDVLGFEVPTDWTLDPSDSGTTSIVGNNQNRTQGASSLEVTAQNYARFNSAPVSSIGSVGPLVLLDVLLPTTQANPSWFGDAQMFVNSPTLGLFNVFLSDVPMTGLALGTWQTLAFQMPATAATAISNGVYSDLTFSVVLNVPFNETGHYLLDNIRSIPDVVPFLFGVAQDGATLKAIFDYQTTSSTPVNIPYGTANGLTNQNGFIASPPEVPPTTFVSTTHAPFVATLSGSLLTWTVGSHSATATPSSHQLPVTNNGDGTHDATLPNGTKVNIDSTPPADPGKVQGPTVGAPFNGVLTGQFSVTPSGAATYTIPIIVPPGIAGMAPNLSLAYNSQASDGIAGQGWNLSGLSMIARCPRTRQQDGFARPIILDSLDNPAGNTDAVSDGICLDGKKLFETVPGSGIYNAEDQDFSTITRLFVNEVDTFTVVTKSGETRYYGRLNNTTVSAQTAGVHQAVWLLDRVADRWGNYFDIQYNNGKGNGPALTIDDPDSFGSSGVWVSKIEYTSSLTNSSCAGLTPPDSCFFATITFQYECRPDIRWSQIGSVRIPQSQRLKSITTPQGTYSLTYATPVAQLQGIDACAVGLGPKATGLSTLDSIGYCDPSGKTCMQPATFQWQGGIQLAEWKANPNYAIPSDVFGGEMFATQFVDINGDGRSDLLVGNTDGPPDGRTPDLATFLNTGSGWKRLSGPGQPLPVYLNDKNNLPTSVRFADFDGDGKLDIIVDSANVMCTTTQVEGGGQTNSCVTCPVGVDPGQPGCDEGPTSYSPAVFLNRFSADGNSGQWFFDTTLSSVSGTGGPSVNFSGNDPTMIADLDGDGKTDLINTKQVQITCNGKTPNCVPGVTTTITAYLNRFGSSPAWQTQTTTSGPGPNSLFNLPLFSPPSGQPPLVAMDVNRDGLADLVNETYFSYPDGSIQSSETILINQGLSEIVGQPVELLFSPLSPIAAATGGTQFSLQQNASSAFADIDGNGFYDLVAFANLQAKVQGVGFGTGTGYGLGPSGAPPGTSYSQVFSAFMNPQLDPLLSWYVIDIDGDGLADLVKDHPDIAGPGEDQTIPYGGEILLNTGLTWISLAGNTSFQRGTGPYRIPAPSPTEPVTNSLGTTDSGSRFVDVDGDGMPDMVFAGDPQQDIIDAGEPFGAGAWMNPNAPLLIKQFPNGLATPSTITYVSTTSAAGASTYKDDDVTDVNTKPLALPINVVSTVVSEDGTGTGTDDTISYTYHSLRLDPKGRGPLGFHRVEAFDQAAQVRTVTTYAQTYPYTGMPIEVDRYQVVGSQSHLTNTTQTTYCDSAALNPPKATGCASLSPGSNPPSTLTLVTQADGGKIAAGITTFVAPSQITDTAYLHPEIDDLTDQTQTVSTFTYDTSGNSTFAGVMNTKIDGGAVEIFQKSVFNSYAASEEQKEGKPDTTTVVSQGGTQEVTHKTTFEYSAASAFGGVSSTLLALSKKHVEPDGGPTRLDIAYNYDKFGNILTTTSCASDFANCNAGGANPSNPNGLGDFVNHPPFRTTTASYDPASLGVTVSYGVGRFPTKVTNAAMQSTLVVYDPVFGKVLTSTDPNGIQTCSSYDALGRLTSQTERCGSVAPLVTTTRYAFALSGAGSGSPPNSMVVTVNTPPTNAPTWSFGDDEGKNTGNLSYAFDGGFIGTTTAYNALGQITQVAKPFHLATLADTPSIEYTQTFYDSFNRVKTVIDPLDVIDSTNVPKSTTITTKYNGSTVETDRVVNGNNQQRFETKNAMGKVEEVQTLTENGLVPIFYAYDAEGDQTCVDENGDSVNDCNNAAATSPMRASYDTRGRKTASVDPDMGSWQYCFNGFGDLYGQIDAKTAAANPTGTCQAGPLTVSITYDVLARMLSKTASTGTANWVYDTAHGAGIGRLAVMVSAPDGNFNGTCAIPQGVPGTGGKVAVKSYVYTGLGELQEVDECADGDSFATSYQYDALGRQSLIRYPVVNTSQLAVGYHYTALGDLQYLTDESTDHSVLWQAKKMNVLGQVTDEQMKNGVETVSTRNPVTGWLLGMTASAHADNDNVIQNQGYGFDELGNLLNRGRNDAGSGNVSQETFGYDLTNRLTTAITFTASGPVDKLYAYDPLGNLTQKDNNTYAYSSGCQAGSRPAGPHAVCSVAGGPQFTYDDNGNLTSDGSRSVSYNPSNRVTGIETGGTGGASVGFMYGADGSRVVQTVTSGGVTTRTVYVGLGGTGKSLYERTTAPGATSKNVHFIYAGSVHGGNAFALRVLDDNGMQTESKYYSFDHLGSVTAMSDDTGRVATVQAAGTSATVFSYDPWGARRNPDGTVADPASFPLSTGDREFTGQEQIPDVGLVNMNGRVYNPVLARFMSADPNVQFAGDLQSYNRYSYVGNNPLRYTDPTGYFWSQIGHFFKTYFSNPLTDIELVTSIAVCAVSGAGCIAVAIEFAALNAAIAISNGAGVAQTLFTSIIGLGIGLATGEILGPGTNPLVSLAVGSASAAYTTVISEEAAGQSVSGYDVLGSALLSAAEGAATLGLGKIVQLSQANTGEGSGEFVNEALARRLSLGNYGSQLTVDDGNNTNGYEEDMQIIREPNSGYHGPRQQETPYSCVSATVRNVVWIDTGQEPAEATIREDIQGDANLNKGVTPAKAVSVLQDYYHVNATRIYPDNLTDLSGVLEQSPAMVSYTIGPGTYHSVLVTGTVVQDGVRYFSVIDPQPTPGWVPLAPVSATSLTASQFSALWNPNQPVIKIW